jgi:CubicO group peptidase (beta-lactamase class C family)
VTRNVANLRAEFPPGSKSAYHVVNYGFILGEVVRRVSGVPVETYLRQHFLDPLGLENTSLGLPAQKRDVASGLYAGCRDQIASVTLFNLPVIRGAVLPAATLHSTARELAVFYQMLLDDGVYAGKRFLKAETIRAATQLGYEGYDEIIEREIRWAFGFQLGGGYFRFPSKDGMGKGSSLDTFGHFGQRTCMTWADRRARLVVAFTCNRLTSKESNEARLIAISDAIWDALVDFPVLDEKTNLEPAYPVTG